MQFVKNTLSVSVAALALSLGSGATAQAQTNEYDIVPNSWIFVMQADADVSSIETTVSKKVGKGKLKHVYKHSVKGFSADMTAQQAKDLADETVGVAYVVPNSYIRVTGKPVSSSKGPSAPNTQITPWGVTRVNGGSYKGNAIAWVVDTGVDSKHPDLRVHKGKSTSIIDNSRGLTDGQGHGTHVAGIIGARDNDNGVLGVAPGVTIASVKVLDDNGQGTAASVIAGVDYAASKARSSDVINLSLGGGYNQALNDAVVRASQRTNVVVAAGNYAGHAKNYSPASAEGQFVFTVSAIDQNDSFSQSSNFGNPPIDCAAPGVNITSTIPGGGIGTFTGTSMAAPHVSGLLLKGNIRTDGFAAYDPDGNGDPICVF